MPNLRPLFVNDDPLPRAALALPLVDDPWGADTQSDPDLTPEPWKVNPKYPGLTRGLGMFCPKNSRRSGVGKPAIRTMPHESSSPVCLQKVCGRSMPASECRRDM